MSLIKCLYSNNKTCLGLNILDSILKFISEKFSVKYKLSLPADESKGIDGYLNTIPVSIKASTYKAKITSKKEKIDVDIIYYEKKRNQIDFEFGDELINKFG